MITFSTALLFSTDPLFITTISLLLLATGSIAGVLAGWLGVGGGIIIVPVLFQTFTVLNVDESLRMSIAVGTSLASIMPTACIAAYAHHQHGSVDSILLRQWGPWVLSGVILGIVFVTSSGHSTILTELFAITAILVALHMVFIPVEKALRPCLPGRAGGASLAVLIGGLSVMLGIGGGTLSVPILSAFSHPIRKAVGTAAALGTVITLPGAIGFALGGENMLYKPPLTVGYINLPSLFLITISTTTTVPFGVRLAHTINPTNLRKGFAAFLVLTSIHMLYNIL